MTATLPVLNFLPHHGAANLCRNFFPVRESDELFVQLLDTVEWKQDHIKIFGRETLQPRLSAAFADQGIEYGYSGIILKSLPWNEPLARIKAKVQETTGLIFNTALLNLYRDGNDYMGWHRDNEGPLGPNPPVASVSLGAKRKFQLRTYSTKSDLVSIELAHGDLLLMLGEVQHFWQHRLPKDRTVLEPRINITFRNILKR
jgi:alkylated DNA repair dioxygenase AlkB